MRKPHRFQIPEWIISTIFAVLFWSFIALIYYFSLYDYKGI